MNAIVLNAVQYLSIGLILYAACLFFLAALGSFIRPVRQKHTHTSGRPSVTLLRYIDGDKSADDVLKNWHDLAQSRYDEVLICRSVDTKRIKRLRTHLSEGNSKVYAPRKTADMTRILRLAYARSRKGERAIALPISFPVSDNFVDGITKDVEKGVIMWVRPGAYANAYLTALVDAYVSIIRNTCQYAAMAVVNLRRKGSSRNAMNIRKISDIFFWMLMGIYVPAAAMTAAIAAVHLQPTMLAALWVLIVAWLVVAAIGSGGTRGARPAIVVSLPLAPLLLWAYAVVYPTTRKLRLPTASTPPGLTLLRL